jgi:hypothetical protein
VGVFFQQLLNPSGPVAATRWKESVASPIPTASPGGPGRVFVTFPKIGKFKQGVVHGTMPGAAVVSDWRQ